MLEGGAIVVDKRSSIIFDVDFHPKDPYAVTVGSDGILKVLHQTDDHFETIAKDQRPRTIRRVSFSPSGDQIVTCGFDGKTIIYSFDPRRENPLEKVGNLTGQDGELKTARWSRDGQFIVTAARDRSVWLWESSNQDCKAILTKHTGDVKDAAFNDDGSLVASVSFDGTLRIWDVDGEDELQNLNVSDGTVWSLCFSDDGESIVTVDENGIAILFTNSSNGFVKGNSLVLQQPLRPLYAVCRWQSKWLVGGADRKIFVLSDQLEMVEKEIETPQIGDINSLKLCHFNPGYVASASDDGTVLLIRVDCS